MKKLALVLAGLTIVSSSVFAQTNPVLSRNAVGYIKRTIGPTQLDFIGVPFVSLSQANNVLSNVFPNPAGGSVVYRWDKNTQQYITYQAKGTSWGPAGTNIIFRGEGVFFNSPAGTTQTYYIMGEVPDRLTAPTSTVSIAEGVTFAAHSYPVATAWTSLTLATQLPGGSQLTIWNKTNGTYTFYQKKGASWGIGTNVILQAGDGFYVSTPSGAGVINWAEAKPYTWP